MLFPPLKFKHDAVYQYVYYPKQQRGLFKPENVRNNNSVELQPLYFRGLAYDKPSGMVRVQIIFFDKKSRFKHNIANGVDINKKVWLSFYEIAKPSKFLRESVNYKTWLLKVKELDNAIKKEKEVEEKGEETPEMVTTSVFASLACGNNNDEEKSQVLAASFLGWLKAQNVRTKFNDKDIVAGAIFLDIHKHQLKILRVTLGTAYYNFNGKIRKIPTQELVHFLNENKFTLKYTLKTALKKIVQILKPHAEAYLIGLVIKSIWNFFTKPQTTTIKNEK